MINVLYTQAIIVGDVEKLRAACKPEMEAEGLPYNPDNIADLAVWALQSEDRPPADYDVEIMDWHAEIVSP